MKTKLINLLSKLKPLWRIMQHYIVFGYIIVLLCIFGFFVFRINQYAHLEPSDDAVQEKLQTVKRPRLDKDVVTKIEQLESQNIEVQSLFDKARSNPFNE
jgi:hypothetical protein